MSKYALQIRDPYILVKDVATPARLEGKHDDLAYGIVMKLPVAHSWLAAAVDDYVAFEEFAGKRLTIDEIPHRLLVSADVYMVFTTKSDGDFEFDPDSLKPVAEVELIEEEPMKRKRRRLKVE